MNPITIKALTVCQPWASLLATGAKLIETRSWYTDYRGSLAIHASKAFPLTDQVLLKERRFFDALRHDYAINDYGVPNLPVGAIIAVTDLVGCRSTNNSSNIPPRDSDEFWFGDFTSDRWLFCVENIRRLEIPIKCKGSLGLWTPDPDIIERLEILL